MNKSQDLKRFESMLLAVDLGIYRTRYLPIKIVEMDMPKNVQAIDLMYRVYWNERAFLDFDSFYKRYVDEYKELLEAFREKTTMCSECFYRGLPARIYRTWASIVTQIHGGYVAESVFGVGTVSMSAELDHKGADFQINYKGTVLNYQVKKTTHSREVRKAKKVSKQIPGQFIDIVYEVPQPKIFQDPYRKDGTERTEYKRFKENQSLRRLSNGFVLFTAKPFLDEKMKLDAN